MNVLTGASGAGIRRPQGMAFRLFALASISFLIATLFGPADPAFAVGETIELINPSKGTSLVLSDKNDGTDALYHIVAAVNSVPVAPNVEFELEDEDGGRLTYEATRVGGTDTWEAFANLPEDSGDYTLRAALFSGQVEVDRDQEAVVVENGGDPTSLKAETTEITYPTNGGNWGIYTSPNNVTVGVIEGTLSSASTPEPGPRYVRAYYTVTPTGTEPVWNECSGGFKSVSGSTYRVRCTIKPAHADSAIRGVAVVPNDTPGGQGSPGDASFDGAADGHRVFSYKQIATAVTVDPETSTVAAASGVFPCKRVTATVTDQNARPISGHNVDVHAFGPNDNLRFDTSGKSGASGRQSGDPSKAPDQNSHQEETAYNCDTNMSGGVQGEHNTIGADDRKHIESTNGTDDAGKYTFALKNFDNQPGITQFNVWADADGDDRFCSQEARGDGAIGWGATEPPGILGEDPETSDCATPPVTQCNDGDDNDGDGRVDGTDRGCIADTTEGGEVKRWSTSFERFAYKRKTGSFEGDINSPKSRCVSFRRIVVKKVKEGPDLKVGETKTNRTGGFSLERPNANGTYYAKAVRKVFDQYQSRNICSEKRSGNVTVNRN